MADPNVERWRGLVESAFPAEAVEGMLEIMQLESNGNPNAHNPGTAENPEDSWGLLQINRLAHGGSPDELRNPATNITRAAAIYARQGFDAWHNARVALGLPARLSQGEPAGAPFVPGMPEGGQFPSGRYPAQPTAPAPAPDILGGVGRIGSAIAEGPLGYLRDTAETLSWLGQTNIWKRIGLTLLGAIVLILGLALFGLSFISKEDVTRVAKAAAL